MDQTDKSVGVDDSTSVWSFVTDDGVSVQVNRSFTAQERQRLTAQIADGRIALAVKQLRADHEKQSRLVTPAQNE
jgi:hypothetical protein